jgi:hypothetical protein
MSFLMILIYLQTNHPQTKIMNRKQVISFSLILGLASFFYACQPELTNPNPATPNITGDFRAKINGVQWVANKATGAARTLGIINISGQGTDGKTITMTLQDSGVRTYFLTPNALQAGAYQDSASGSIGFGSNASADTSKAGGIVNITVIDTVRKTISGTFRFKVYRATDSATRSLTEGVFNNISYAPVVVAPSGTDTFRVKVDGVDFPYTSLNGIRLTTPLDIVSVTASTANSAKTVGITMPGNVTVGTYNFVPFGFDYIGQYNINTSATSGIYMSSNAGSVQILEHNLTTKRIRGNFTFRAKALLSADSANLTAGYFSVKYP